MQNAAKEKYSHVARELTQKGSLSVYIAVPLADACILPDEPPPHRLEYEQRKRGNHKIHRRRNHKDPMPMTTIVLEEAGQRHNPGCCAFRGVEQPGISCGVFRAEGVAARPQSPSTTPIKKT